MDIPKEPEKPANPVPPTVFISHAHGDRELATALTALIRGAYSGAVKTFQSSNLRPSQGLSPGDQWSVRIHHELSMCRGLWALATPLSITRPWLYWESGIAFALHGIGPVIVRIGVSVEDLPSPLSQFQSYDGSGDGSGSIGELVQKFAEEHLGLAPDEDVIDLKVSQWAESARSYKPANEGDTDQRIERDRMDRFEVLVGRLEGFIGKLETSRTPSLSELGRFLPPIPHSWNPIMEMMAENQPRSVGPLEGRSRQLRADVESNRVLEEKRRLLALGTSQYSLEDPELLIATLEHAASSGARVTFDTVDTNGDLRFMIRSTGDIFYLWARGAALDGIAALDERSGVSDVVMAVVQKAVAELRQDPRFSEAFDGA